MLLLVVIAWSCVENGRAATNSPAVLVLPAAGRGEFSCSLDFLRKHCSGPRGAEESNFFVDLWAEQNLKKLAFECGLTNNHALFINAHGVGVLTGRGTQYSYQPHQSLLAPNEKAPHYSVGDLLKILGPLSADKIHNILVSGCNVDGSFSSRELRKYFVNATNIIHMAAGRFGYQSMYFQVLTRESSQIKPLYEICAKNKAGKLEFFLENTPSANATLLSPYVAELFRPGTLAPYRTQTAGREILVPAQPSLLISRARISARPPERGCPSAPKR